MAELKMKNYMEDCVINILSTVIGSRDICQCERCKMDIIACALNKLPAKYVVSDAGDIYTRIQVMHSQFKSDITTAVTQAVELISANPRHDQA